MKCTKKILSHLGYAGFAGPCGGCRRAGGGRARGGTAGGGVRPDAAAAGGGHGGRGRWVAANSWAPCHQPAALQLLAPCPCCHEHCGTPSSTVVSTAPCLPDMLSACSTRSAFPTRSASRRPGRRRWGGGRAPGSAGGGGGGCRRRRQRAGTAAWRRRQAAGGGGGPGRRRRRQQQLRRRRAVVGPARRRDGGQAAVEQWEQGVPGRGPCRRREHCGRAQRRQHDDGQGPAWRWWWEACVHQRCTCPCAGHPEDCAAAGARSGKRGVGRVRG